MSSPKQVVAKCQGKPIYQVSAYAAKRQETLICKEEQEGLSCKHDLDLLEKILARIKKEAERNGILELTFHNPTDQKVILCFSCTLTIDQTAQTRRFVADMTSSFFRPFKVKSYPCSQDSEEYLDYIDKKLRQFLSSPMPSLEDLLNEQT